tara:strand:- start:21065 stop:21352 length:288 start_codon:yes stop_codon:yes gene_type:complete
MKVSTLDFVDQPKITALKNRAHNYFGDSFSSKFILGGSLLTPTRLVLNNEGVTILKRKYFSTKFDTLFLTYDEVSYIKTYKRLFSATIIISSLGS